MSLTVDSIRNMTNTAVKYSTEYYIYIHLSLIYWLWGYGRANDRPKMETPKLP